MPKWNSPILANTRRETPFCCSSSTAALRTLRGTTNMADDPVGEELSLVNDNHLPDLLRELCELREKGSFCDVVVEVQSRRYLAHKAVLSSTCRYFRSLFLDVPCSSMGPFVIDFLTIKLFHQILEFVYKGHIKADKVEIRDLYKAAKDLGLDCLEEICQRIVPLEYLEECSDSESEISQSLSDAGAQMSASADGCVEDGAAISAENLNDVDGGGKTNPKHKAENCVTKNKGEKSRQSNDARSSDSVQSHPCNGNKPQKSVKAGKNSEQEFCISNVESMSRRAGERAVAESSPDKHDAAQRRGDFNYTPVGICEVKMEPLDEEAFILPSHKESRLSHVGLKANDSENEMVQSSDVKHRDPNSPMLGIDGSRHMEVIHAMQSYPMVAADSKLRNQLHVNDFAPRLPVGATDSFVLCQVCGEFVQEMGLKDHAAVHLDLATMECKVCGVAFGSFGEAVEHVLLHTGITASPCEGCGEVFLSKDSLSLHVRDCGKGESKDHLDDFQMDESEGLDGGPPERVFCQVCGVSLPRKFLAVRKHAKCHVDSEKRECRVCGRKCNYLSNVIKHTLIHIGVCLFTCDICGKKFLNRNNLMAHRRRVCLNSRCYLSEGAWQHMVDENHPLGELDLSHSSATADGPEEVLGTDVSE
ncbi:unnamed protein product [Lampetra fluviatilis]